MKRILVVDDDVAVTNFLTVFFMQTERFDCSVINDSREVPAVLDDAWDVFLLDMDMPNVSGVDILNILRQKGLHTPVIILTGVSDVELAVKAMKLGAFDYLTKPVDEEHLLRVIDTAIEHSSIASSVQQVPLQLKREDITHTAAFSKFQNQDPQMIRCLYQAEKIAASDLSIFIWGERGTGRETLARAIHEASRRSERPFVALDVAEQEPARFPATFFGQARDWSGTHEDMAGFLEQAEGGTLYLDNIEQLSLPMQVRLKRVIQGSEYYRENSTRILTAKVRFIVASTRDLRQPEFNEVFNRDLLYHLMVNSISIPPLRDRPVDIPILARSYLESEAELTGRPVRCIAPEVVDLLLKYPFPDNAQELRTLICAAVAYADGEELTVDDLPPYIQQKLDPDVRPQWKDFRPLRLDDVVREHVRSTLDFFGKDKDKASNELGISPERLQEILGAG
jgi:DNA-binding NtrC family response regulator